ncbi:MAG: nicotinate (nicotinamide) nucleotide adenylyltransferase [Planctomycetota bacterium]
MTPTEDRTPGHLPPVSHLPVEGDGEAGVVLFGGTFDPPHVGHIALAAAARDAAAPGAWLVFVPAARSPHKERGPIASDADRVEMLRLAIAEAPRAVVWTDEIDRAEAGGRSGASYWVTTLERARTALGPEAPMRFIVGADQAVAFRRWHEPERILELADPVVLVREPIGSAAALEAAMRASGEADPDWLERWRGRCVRAPKSDASSTAVRAALAAGDARTASVMLTPAVAGYIDERGLYCENE